MTVGELYRVVDRIAPFNLAFEWDRVGIQVGRIDAPVNRVLVALDPSHGAIKAAVAGRFQCIVAHHPVIWEPLTAVLDGPVHDLTRTGLGFIAAHTNWDCAKDGLNDALAAKLGLQDIRPLESRPQPARLKLVVFVPEKNAKQLIDTLSEAGAGNIGAYSRCAFTTPGTGTFHGGKETNPVVGEAGRIEEVEELRLEMVLDQSRLDAVVDALRRTHPYEEPAFDVYPLESVPGPGCGRMGSLPSPLDAEAFRLTLNERLHTRSLVWSGGGDVRTVAVVGGAASGSWTDARIEGADAFVTGEVKQADALTASGAGLTVVSAGHYATEQPGMAHLCERLKEAAPGVEFELYVPEPGADGRPL